MNVSADIRLSQESPPHPSPYLQQLAAISSPVPDFAATLTTQTEEDANDDNVSFLRTRLRTPPPVSSSSPARRDRELHPAAGHFERLLREHRVERRTTSDSTRRIPTVRHVDSSSDQSSNYTNRNPQRQSLYDWAPGSDDDGDDILNEVREHAAATTRWNTFARSEGRTDASHNMPSLPRDEPSGRTISSQSHLLQDAAGDILSRPYADAWGSSLTTAALLQSVRRHPRFANRTRSTLQNYILDRERAGTRADERDRSSSTTRILRHSDPQSNVNSHNPSSYRDSANFSQVEIRARVEAHRQMYLENPSSNRLKEAIKYLGSVRFSSSQEESVSSASAGGLVNDGFITADDQDFILDTTTLDRPPQSSWLMPGSVFSGSQHAASLGQQSSMLSHRLNRPSQRAETMRSLGLENSISTSTSSGRRYWAAQHSPKDDHWPVKVSIHDIDYSTMTLCGTMEAHNIPDKSSPTQDTSIITYLEGEIIDFNVHTLETKNFHSDAETDSMYWRALQPFQDLTDEEMVRNIVSRRWLTEELSQHWILMRWKGKDRQVALLEDAAKSVFRAILCATPGRAEWPDHHWLLLHKSLPRHWHH